jgi:hypothetical protein
MFSATDPHVRTPGFLDRSRYYFFQALNEAEWTPFQMAQMAVRLSDLRTGRALLRNLIFLFLVLISVKD